MRKGREDFVLGKVENLMMGCAVLVAAGAVGITVFIFAARPPLRRLYARRLVNPLTVLGVLALEMGMFWLMLQAVRGNVLSPDGLNAWLSESDDPEAGAGTALLGSVLGLLALVAPHRLFRPAARLRDLHPGDHLLGAELMLPRRRCARLAARTPLAAAVLVVVVHQPLRQS
ncbi:MULTISPECIES: hypothetical protein [unclassified Streptomyces]|uniref:hypothetical protein n=1 Tax=unclassified Streptomyces TaxID=2593676 RepID=UPI0011607242|nr:MULTISPECIES: hypothetical protein [unclassified Streptomyces]